MNDEEQHILDFLKGSPDAFFARREIARKAVRRSEFEEEPRWADGPLKALVDRKLVEMNDSGQFRLASNNKYR